MPASSTPRIRPCAVVAIGASAAWALPAPNGAAARMPNGRLITVRRSRVGFSSATRLRGAPTIPLARAVRSARRQQLRHLEQDHLVVVGAVEKAAGGEWQVVVVADDDVLGVDHGDVLDGEEREVEAALAAALTRLLVRIGDCHQIDVAE